MGPITIWCDSDWAGCTRTRRSTNGGALCIGSHVVKTWATTQAKIALSSGGAEYNTFVKGCSQALFMKALLADLGCDNLDIGCHTDSSVAIGIMNLTGLGKVRHVAVHLLWLQDHVREKRIKIRKFEKTKNPADILTKHVERAISDRYFHRLHLSRRGGRADSAPTICQQVFANHNHKCTIIAQHDQHALAEGGCMNEGNILDMGTLVYKPPACHALVVLSVNVCDVLGCEL